MLVYILRLNSDSSLPERGENKGANEKAANRFEAPRSRFADRYAGVI